MALLTRGARRLIQGFLHTALRFESDNYRRSAPPFNRMVGMWGPGKRLGPLSWRDVGLNPAVAVPGLSASSSASKKGPRLETGAKGTNLLGEERPRADFCNAA